TKVMDKVDTGKNGFEFIKLDTGMDSNTRPSLYGSRHPLITVTANGSLPQKTKNYVVVGHCCESGDLFTQKEGGSPETREMMEANIGDLVVMEGTGAYCSGMSTKNYNSYPETPEVLIKSDGQKVLIRKKQELKQIFENEIEIAV
ncbi:MAG TPA: diaminopimelate decarboxylase, partial [Leptospiraceae bacterium]|nr:diaminopimelate decarboxylase [Leptospiraceae bacterium]